MEDDIKKLKEEIEKIKTALINFRPDFKYDFCEHESEKIWVAINNTEIESKQITSGRIILEEPIYRCRKCGLILNADGTPSIQRA